MDNTTKLESMVERALVIANMKQSEIERSTWMAVHEHLHGVPPVEYDIREIDEDLYLEVLDLVRKRI